MSEKCPICRRGEGEPHAPECWVGRMAYLEDQLAQKDRELEQSRQREAQALAVVAEAKVHWDALKGKVHSYEREHFDEDRAHWNRLDTILADAPKVLAVVDIPNDQTTLVLSSDPSERVTVLKEHIGGGRFIVLGRDESEGT